MDIIHQHLRGFIMDNLYQCNPMESSLIRKQRVKKSHSNCINYKYGIQNDAYYNRSLSI